VEGLVALLVALAVFVAFDGRAWLLVVLALAPDLSVLGYLASPRIGRLACDLVHPYVLPGAIGAAVVWFDVPIAVQVAGVWVALIGADRLSGYGLEFPTGFRETLSSDQSAPAAVPIEQ